MGYPISGVTRLTGIPADTLRAWERRYGAVRPRRDHNGKREYSLEEVERLCLLKRRVERGEQISKLAPLSLNELSRGSGSDSARGEGSRTNVLMLGRSAADLDAPIRNRYSIHLIDRSDSLVDTHVLLLHTPLLNDQYLAHAKMLQKSAGAEAVVIAYESASRTVVEMCPRRSVRAVNAKAGPEEVARACAEARRGRYDDLADDGDDTGTRHFTDAELAELAVSRSVGVKSYQKQFASLIMAVKALEAQSRMAAADTGNYAGIDSLVNSVSSQLREQMESTLVDLLADDTPNRRRLSS